MRPRSSCSSRLFVKFQVTNKLRLMERLPYTCLMIFCLFVSIYGGGEDSFPSCEVELMVQRHTTWESPPEQSVTLSCPFRQCGNSLRVTWCKLLDTKSCERMNETENIEIRQNDGYVKGELTSRLTFKRISIHDDGLYRCHVKGYKRNLISHTINVSVSDIYQGVEKIENADNIAGSLSAAAVADEKVSWLPYFYICVAVAFLVVTLTVLNHLSSYCWKQVLTCRPTKGQEISTHMIPDLPKGSAPSAPVLEAHFALTDIYSSSTAGTPTSPPFLITSGNQPLASTANESKVSETAVYAVINHRQSGIHAKKQHAATQRDKNPDYAAISVS